MIEIKVSGNTIEEVTEAMARALGGIGIASAVKNDVRGTVEITQTDDEASEVPTLTLDEVKRLAKVKVDEGKSKAVKALLTEMGASKLDGLEEAQFAEFVEKLEEL